MQQSRPCCESDVVFQQSPSKELIVDLLLDCFILPARSAVGSYRLCPWHMGSQQYYLSCHSLALEGEVQSQLCLGAPNLMEWGYYEYTISARCKTGPERATDSGQRECFQSRQIWSEWGEPGQLFCQWPVHQKTDSWQRWPRGTVAGALARAVEKLCMLALDSTPDV